MITEVFAFKARKEAEANGIPGLPIIVIPHPVGQLPRESVAAVADQAFDEILNAITCSSVELEERYGNQSRSTLPNGTV